MIALAAAPLIVQALVMLSIACDADSAHTPRERVWAVVLAASSLLGAFALLGWTD